MINYTRKRRDSTSSTQTTMSAQPEHQSQSRRSLRNVPSISSMIKSTSLRSINNLDDVNLAPSMSRPITRRQSLTRATASSLAKMVNFTSSSDNALLVSPSPTTSTKQPSRFNKLLKKKKNQPVEQAPVAGYQYGGPSSLSKKKRQKKQQQDEDEDDAEQSTSADMIENTMRKKTAAVAHLPSPPATPLPRRRWSPFRSPRTSQEIYSFDDEDDSIDDKPPELPPIEHGSFSLELSISDHRRRSMPPCLTPSSSPKKRHSVGNTYYASNTSTVVLPAAAAAAAAEYPQSLLSSMPPPRPHRSMSTSSKLKSCSACPGRKNGATAIGPDNEDHPDPIKQQVQEAAEIKEDREMHLYEEQGHQQQRQPGVDCGDAEPQADQLVLLPMSDVVPLEEEDTMAVVPIPDDNEKSAIVYEKTDVISVASINESSSITTCDDSEIGEVSMAMQVNADTELGTAIAPAILPTDDEDISPRSSPIIRPARGEEEKEALDSLAAIDLLTPTDELPVAVVDAIEADPLTPVQSVEEHEPEIPETNMEQEPDDDSNAPVSAPTAVVPTQRPSGIALMQPLCSRGALVPATDQSLVQLVASCIAHAEKLESLAMDLSRSEDRVSELLDTHQALIQSLDAREHRYKMHVQTYESLLASQARMISELEAIQGKLSPRPLRCWSPPPSQPTTMTSTMVLPSWWPVQRPTVKGTIISQQKNDLGYTTDLVVTGTCVAPNPPQHLLLTPHDAADDSAATALYHHYLLHIKQEERSVKYALCPIEHWVPDAQADTCQHPSCKTEFGLFTRRHHCRSCGYVVCNTHSQNRLPLFKLMDRNRGEWARVCDACFYRLLDPN